MSGGDVTTHDLNLTIEVHLEQPDLGVVPKLLEKSVRGHAGNESEVHLQYEVVKSLDQV